MNEVVNYEYPRWEEKHLLGEEAGWVFLLCTRSHKLERTFTTLPHRVTPTWEALLLALPEEKVSFLACDSSSWAFQQQLANHGLFHLFAPRPLPWLLDACREVVVRLSSCSPWAWVGGGTNALTEEVTSPRSFFGVNYSRPAEEGVHSPLELLLLYLQEAAVKRRWAKELQVFRDWERELPLLSPEALLSLVPEEFSPPAPPESGLLTTLTGKGALAPAPLAPQLEDDAVTYGSLFHLLRPEGREALLRARAFGREHLPRASLDLVLASLPWHPSFLPEGVAFPPEACTFLANPRAFLATLTSVAGIHDPEGALGRAKVGRSNHFSTYRLASLTPSLLEDKRGRKAYGKLLQQWLLTPASRQAATVLQGKLTPALTLWEAQAFAPLLKKLLAHRHKFSQEEYLALTRELLTPPVVSTLVQWRGELPPRIHGLVLGVVNHREGSAFPSNESFLLLPRLQELLGPQGTGALLASWRREEWGLLTEEVVEEVARHPEWRGMPPSWWLPLLVG